MPVNTHRFRKVLSGLVLSLCALAAPAFADGGHDPHNAGATRIPFDASVLARLPHEAVAGSAHGKTLRCTGVPLAALLRDAGALPAGPLRGPALAHRVEITARDGYRIAFALAEIDPTLGPTRAFVVDACNGAPLTDDDGPVRLLVPTDARAARWIRQIERIDVVGLP